jgi:hypothetical protein
MSPRKREKRKRACGTMSTIRRASARFKNQCSLRHSSRRLSPQADTVTVALDGRDASNVSFGRPNPWRLTDNLGHRAGSAEQPTAWGCTEVPPGAIMRKDLRWINNLPGECC